MAVAASVPASFDFTPRSGDNAQGAAVVNAISTLMSGMSGAQGGAVPK